MKKYFILSLLIIITPIYAKHNFYISAGSGINYTEDFFAIIYRSQLSPKFFLNFTHTKDLADTDLSISSNIFLSVDIFDKYYKSYLYYFTDKTLSIKIPLEYSFLFEKKLFPFFTLSWGSGFIISSRYDRYSIGLYSWHSTFRESIAPSIIGKVKGHYKLFYASLLHEIGIGVSVDSFFLQDEFYETFFNIFGQHKLNFETGIKLPFKSYLYVGWINKFNSYLDSDDFIGNLFFENNFYGGIKIEL